MGNSADWTFLGEAKMIEAMVSWNENRNVIFVLVLDKIRKGFGIV